MPRGHSLCISSQAGRARIEGRLFRNLISCDHEYTRGVLGTGFAGLVFVIGIRHEEDSVLKRKAGLISLLFWVLCCQPSFGQVVYEEITSDAINVSFAGVSVGSDGRLWSFYPQTGTLTGVGTIAGQSAPGLGPLTTILPVTGGTVSSK